MSRHVRERIRPRVLVLAAAGLTVLGLALTAGSVGGAGHADAAAPPQNVGWPHYGNDLGGMRYQNFSQITPKTVARLAPAWIFHTSVANDRTSFEAQPIVVGKTLYVSSPHDHVFALDAANGKLKWTYDPMDMPPIFSLALCCGESNRGVAVGGGKVYIARLDDVLVALDQKTGKVDWKVPVASWHDKYSETMAPQYVNGKVLVGTSGGEYQARGSITAFDARNGHKLWRFYTTKPGSWGGAAWKHGGATVWTTPEVDPKLGLVYVHTGNPAPDVNGSKRPGRDLYSASIVALHLSTGKLKWYFQEVHHDLWDYDAGQPAQLYTVDRNGTSIPAIGEAGKDGYYFILDRRTGKPIFPVHEVKVPSGPSWQHPYPTQPESQIRLVPDTVTVPPNGMGVAPMWTPPSQQPVLEQPGAEMAGPEWPPGAYSPRTHYAYIASGGYSPWAYSSSPKQVNTYGSTGAPPNVVGHIDTYGIFSAVDTQSGTIAWQTKVPRIAASGVAVAGDLVFWGHSDGTFVAQDAKTGKVLWTWKPPPTMANVGGANGAPAVYMVGGREYVVMAFGGSSHIRGDTGASSSPLGDALIAFALAKPSSHTTVTTAYPVQVPVGAPEKIPGVASPPPGAKVVGIETHDLNYYPDHFSVKAGRLVAIELTNTGLLPQGFAVSLGPRTIGLAKPVEAGHEIYFVFKAPKKPGGYRFFSSIEPDHSYVKGGVMHVTR